MSAYGCFTTVRLEAGGVRGWDMHLRRLVRDTGLLFDRPVTEAEILAAVRDRAGRMSPASADPPVLLRIAVTARDDTLSRPGGSDLAVEVTYRPAYGEVSALRVGTTPHRRSMAHIKHLGITPELLSRRRARCSGHDDALFLDDERVTEGPTWSLLARVGDQIVAPTGGLPSITAALLAGVAPISARVLGLGELSAATDAVALNAAWGVRPIATIDGRPMVGTLGAELASAYANIAPQPILPPPTAG